MGLADWSGAWGLGLGVQGLVRVGVWGFSGLGLRVQGFGFSGVWGLGVWGLGVQAGVSGFGMPWLRTDCARFSEPRDWD